MNNSVSPTIASGNFPWQTTISKPKSFSGIGLHSGNLINVKLKPSKVNSGIVFVRTDKVSSLTKLVASLVNITFTLQSYLTSSLTMYGVLYAAMLPEIPSRIFFPLIID